MLVLELSVKHQNIGRNDVMTYDISQNRLRHVKILTKIRIQNMRVSKYFGSGIISFLFCIILLYIKQYYLNKLKQLNYNP